MSTNPRTRRLVTALVERYPEFKDQKPEWWNDTSFELGRTDDACTAPDLTNRANLAELFDVCDAIGTGGNIITGGGLSGYATRTYWVDIVALSGQHTGTGPTRTDALLASAEDALGLEKWEEVARG